MAGSRIEVRTAGPERLAALAAVFGRAFVDEPMMRWPLGEPGNPVDRFTRCFAYCLEEVLPLGMVWEVGDAAGAAIWFPPGASASWETHPWDQPRIGALADDGGVRYDAFWGWVEAHSPAEPMWQLDSIAVDPIRQGQGQGFGAALIAAGLARARADGVGAFLSTGTARNVPIYGRCGFRVSEEAPAPGGGPRIWFMRWDP